MKKRIIIFFVFINFLSLLNAQEKCNHKELIFSFLNKVTSEQYKSSLNDFELFFDINSKELEMGLRWDYIKNHPGTNLTFDTDSISLAIEKFLENETVRHLIKIKNRENREWTIKGSFNYGSKTIIFRVGLEGIKDIIQIQMINHIDEERCGIVDIMDSDNNSILYPAQKIQ
ncbi:MAG TPA: hypothetical protein P5320_09090 [Bacteroidales bacterium]|nr:hypothetical protein [Bacteroidales bacterium]HOK74785.1 hypothetical protein [Bacteroidales bacterium]HOM41700.1 hypothetical protein [Bacteroidales bacterium]HPP93480.1 hypothetical protein [Bacteroidales bacterium]HQK70736.1 hypothetical protein [Bacteroidales bacterium]